MEITKEFLNITPAESMVLLDPGKANGKEMMKLTLVDLIMKNIISVDVRQERKGKIRKRLVDQTYLKPGKSKEEFDLKNHEDIFYRALGESGELHLSKFAENVREQVSGSDGFRNWMVREPLYDSGYLEKQKKKRFFIPTTVYTLSDKGIRILEKINELIKLGEDNLEKWIQQEPKNAKAYIAICSANIFLLNNVDLQTVKSWSSNFQDTPLESSAFEFLPYIWGTQKQKAIGDPSSFYLLHMNFGGLNSFDSLDDFDSDIDFDSDMDFGD